MQSEGSFPEETAAVDHHHPLRPLAPLGFSDSAAPFFAGAKLRPKTIRSTSVAGAGLTRSETPARCSTKRPAPPSLAAAASRSRDAGISPACLASEPRSAESTDPFQHLTIRNPRTTTLALFGRLGKQGRDLLPLRFGQQRTRSGHRPSFGAADSPYLSSQKTQLPSFHYPVLGCATASSEFEFFHGVVLPECCTSRSGNFQSNPTQRQITQLT